MIDDIQKLRIINKLKTTYRFSTVENRKESTAEHTWSAMIWADFFLTNTNTKLDRVKVYELLMYHDVAEIYAGDTPLHPEIKQTNKKEKELNAAQQLQKELPTPINNKFFSLFQEFEERKTPEAKFAKAIDALDAEIHELDYKEDWKGWTKEFLIEKKSHLFEEFPELKKILDLIENL